MSLFTTLMIQDSWVLQGQQESRVFLIVLNSDLLGCVA